MPNVETARGPVVDLTGATGVPISTHTEAATP